MKNLQHKIPWAMMLLALLAMVSCRKDKDILTTIGGVIEDSPVEDDSKVYLSDRERWLRWETGDEIFVWSTDNHYGIYELDPASNTHLTGTFTSNNSEITANSTLYAFYPITMTSGTNPAALLSYPNELTLNLPSTHPYRDNTLVIDPATDPDSSFGRGVMPMVAYRPEHDAHELFFHSLAGILRFQLYAGPDLTDEATDEFEITQIIIEAHNQRLSGAFKIKKESIEDNQPYLTAEPLTGDPNEKKITITGINQKIGGTGTNKNNLFTFYLPLPAVAYPYGDVQHYTTYELKMHVFGKQSNGSKVDIPKYFVRTMKVDIRRLSVTMMQAMEINVLDDNSDGRDSEGTPTIVGCGTEARPFQIYTAKELKYLRDCCNNSLDPRVNGQPITANTYIKICRSDILLTTSTAYDALSENDQKKAAVWTEGFNNFTGHLYFSSSAGETGGITNISGHPLFESISSQGEIKELYVKGDLEFNAGSGTFSPMCNINYGTMKDCHNRCNVSSTSGHNLAGLCCTNYGTIEGGANDALLTTTGNVAGICYTNSGSGTLQGNFSLSTAVPDGANIAGICYDNSGEVRDCQVSANITNINSSGNWGVVVFNNSGTVTNCRSVGTVIFTTTGSIGGVVNTNTGTVDGCSLNVTLRGGSGSVGGIVAVMNDGEVRNCYAKEGDVFIYGIPRSGASNRATYAGGIVGHLHDGDVRNCYNRCSVIGATNSGAILGRIDEDATIENCWSDLATLGFLGDVSIRDDQGEIGPFCFSAKTTDTNLNCVLLIKNWYRIKVPWSMRANAKITTFYSSSPVDPETQSETDHYLCNALNAWLPNPNDSPYRSWTSTIGQAIEIYPVFIDPTTTKHYRKQRYPHRR